MLTPPAALLSLLFTSGNAVPKKDVSKVLGCNHEDLSKAISVLHESLEGTGLAVIETEADLELRTAPEAMEIVQKFRESEVSKDLGKAGLETLAAIAYRTGSTRGEIDWIRGVNSSASLRTLLLRGLIEGKEDPSDKRRIRYSITTEALAYLGVTKVEQLPRFDELSKESEQVVLETSKNEEVRSST